MRVMEGSLFLAGFYGKGLSWFLLLTGFFTLNILFWFGGSLLLVTQR
jgi:hypothetical protein